MSQIQQQTYWRSLNELAETEEFRSFVESEFPSRLDSLVDPTTRRRFLQVMGASFALAGMSGCDFFRWPKEKILPYTRRPEGRIPGTPVQYATTFEVSGVAQGLLASSFDGRPVKLEGNPLHPSNGEVGGDPEALTARGATDSAAQATILGLYDPDRSRAVRKASGEAAEGEAQTVEQFLGWARKHFEALRSRENQGGLRVVSPLSSSPTVARLRARLEEVFAQGDFAWIEYEPLARDQARAGSERAFGSVRREQLDLTKAAVVVSFDEDLLEGHPNRLRYGYDFVSQRDPDGARMARLYCVESVLSLTGAAADHRLALQAGQVREFAMQVVATVAAEIGQAGATLAAAAGEARESYAHRGLVRKIADDLLANRGASVLVVGERQPAELHALVHLLNGLLGNVGETVRYTEDPCVRAQSSVEAIAALAEDLEKDRVDTVVFLGGNPLYDAPADLDLGVVLGRAEHKIHLGLYYDETARSCTWHVPQAHYLEAWGDARAWDGTYCLGQPLIAPLFGGVSPVEMLALMIGRDASGYQLVRETLALSGHAGEGDERAARRLVHDGLVRGTALEPVEDALQTELVLAGVEALKAEATPASAEDLELLFVADAKVYDGRWANNGWLQELPEPISKLTWDNGLLMGHDTAEALGLKDHQNVMVTCGEASLQTAVVVVPGLPLFTTVLSLGYGRGAEAGVVAEGVGFNAYKLRRSDAMHVARGVTLEAREGLYDFATTQDHHSIRSEVGDQEVQKRVPQLIQSATLSEYQKNPRFAKGYAGPNPYTTQLWDSPIDYRKHQLTLTSGEVVSGNALREDGDELTVFEDFAGTKAVQTVKASDVTLRERKHRWGLTIDLNGCTGCGSCVVACQAENNIPVVGKSEVARGREMSWLRVDRYFAGDPRVAPVVDAHGEEQPRELRVVHQPVMCMQCENAPCEAVCPVAATVHSQEGLNDMVYNRCIGTRYCSNNCPYKVRRFNYFYNHYGPFHPRSEPIKLGGKVASQLPKPPELTAQPGNIEQMAHNPEVTVRSRGVMEKCTYCVQRIKAVTIPARNARREVRDGEIKVACQQACPTQAISFGDLNDPESRVHALMQHDRDYQLLVELNTRARTRYLAQVRNPSETE